jgi:iron complex outermembrane receptor protein
VGIVNKNNLTLEIKVPLSLNEASPALLGGFGSIAHAQEDDTEETSRLNTMTVTGTKREQTLQDTELAISVDQVDVVGRAEIQDLNDLNMLRNLAQ